MDNSPSSGRNFCTLSGFLVGTYKFGIQEIITNRFKCENRPDTDWPNTRLDTKNQEVKKTIRPGNVLPEATMLTRPRDANPRATPDAPQNNIVLSTFRPPCPPPRLVIKLRCSTPRHLLQRYYRQGYPAGLTNKTDLPYALPWHNAISDAEGQHRVGWFCHSRYLHDMEAMYTERTGSRFDIFYRTMDLTNPIKALQYDQTEAEQAEQANASAEQTKVGTSTPSGPRPAGRPTTASADSQSTDRQANVAAIGSNRC